MLDISRIGSFFEGSQMLPENDHFVTKNTASSPIKVMNTDGNSIKLVHTNKNNFEICHSTSFNNSRLCHIFHSQLGVLWRHHNQFSSFVKAQPLHLDHYISNPLKLWLVILFKSILYHTLGSLSVGSLFPQIPQLQVLPLQFFATHKLFVFYKYLSDWHTFRWKNTGKVIHQRLLY